MERRWITVKECSLYLGLHLKSVYEKISRGEIPAARLGRVLRVDLRRLEVMMEGQQKTK